MTDHIWWNGRIVPFSEATVHVTSETAQRGLNVFEGLRAYWRTDRQHFAIVSVGEHLTRLRNSLRLLSLPAGGLVDAMDRGLIELIGAVGKTQDLYLRPTIYLDSGSYTSDPDQCSFGSFISCRVAPLSPPVTCHISSYRRVPADSFPPRAKSGASYSIFRLARLEASAAGYDEAILLDRDGTITETCGASVFVVHGGRVSTPPLSVGILDSITRTHALRILRERLGVEAVERPVSAHELLEAEEVFLTGTLDEVRLVKKVHGAPPTLACIIGSAVRDEYLRMCRGSAAPLSADMFTEVRL